MKKIKKITGLTTRSYLGVGLILSLFIGITQWMDLFTEHTGEHLAFVANPVIGIIEILVWTLLCIFNVFAYPWVRINILGDIDHPFRAFKKADNRAEKHWRDADKAYKETPYDYKAVEVVEDNPFYEGSKSVSVYYTKTGDYSKRKASGKEESRALNSQMLSFFLGILMLFVDLFIWYLSPILIWFSLGKRTFTKAANLGYLKPEYYSEVR